MKSLFLPLLKFVAITGPVAWWWMHGGQDAYFKAWIEVARPILKAIGVTGFPPSLVKERFLNFLPFVALMAITPGFSLSSRLVRTAIGLVGIFMGQLGLTYWGWVTFVRDGQTVESSANFFPAVMLSDALPFVLWTILANRFVSEFLLKIIPPVPGATARTPLPPMESGGQSAPAVTNDDGASSEPSPEVGAEPDDQRSTGKNLE
jgi:hypothetical protein